MKCEKCHFEFCWRCLGSYAGYKHEAGMEIYCNFKGTSYFLVVCFFLLMIGMKMVYLFWPTFLTFSLPTLPVLTTYEYFNLICGFFMQFVLCFVIKDVNSFVVLLVLIPAVPILHVTC
jgi:hypothetical protein